MKIVYSFFAARRYWKDEDSLQEAYQHLSALVGDKSNVLITDDDLTSLPTGDCLVVVPMSGAVQKNVLAAANQFPCTVLYGAYIQGNASAGACSAMLEYNAAPTLMDVWAVLHRTHPCTMLALNPEELQDRLLVLQAYTHIKGARMLKIGETEPWVVSNASSPEVYEKRLGVEIVSVPQNELKTLYDQAEDKAAEPYYQWFMANSQGCVEPTKRDLRNAARMAWALVALLDKYQAAGAAIACFNLLKTGTTACLGVSYLNDCTDKVIACECDMDSAITMLIMKKLTRYKLWMANPGLQPDGTINFSHCTSPICIWNEPLPTILRSHHESGIGVALQVKVPANQIVTACRISDESGKVTIHRGITSNGPYEKTCRTQVYVQLDNLKHYLQTALGCHQVFAFEDITEKMEELAKLLRLEVL